MTATAWTGAAYHAARMYLATAESRERDRTGIRSLRVDWNEVQGFYIEITLAATSSRFAENPEWDLPPEYKVISSPMNVHRFCTDELARAESLVMKQATT